MLLGKDQNQDCLPVELDQNSQTLKFDWTAKQIIELLGPIASKIRSDYYC